jgi:hypothetical protein
MTFFSELTKPAYAFLRFFSQNCPAAPDFVTSKTHYTSKIKTLGAGHRRENQENTFADFS